MDKPYGDQSYPDKIQTNEAGLIEEIRATIEAEKILALEDGRITIRVEFFKELITARCTLWALESAGVDNWEGYDGALSEPLGDAWLEELT